MKVREIPKDAMSKRPWLAAAESFNHLYVIDCHESGWSAVAKKANGTAFDPGERKSRR